ncbi:MAG: 4'-phosphopantetheinyl transferase superfamily protein [Chitinophagia bacterium]|nr:4'-phosphopantetheinyl transferase superfamily protein [Chitinophagia bacterium]
MIGINNRFVNWQFREAVMPLEENTIDVWRICVSEHLPNLSFFYEQLPDSEKATAEKYKQEADYRRYIMAHGGLRYLLSHYTHTAATQLGIEIDEQGKPYLKDSDIHFNISHSGNFILIAFGYDPVGIDVEERKENVDWQGLIQKIGDNTEQEYVKTAETPTDNFFIIWTRKEALLKAIGVGLVNNLPSIKVMMYKYRASVHDPFYKIDTFHCARGYQASIAYTKKPFINYLQFQKHFCKG